MRLWITRAEPGASRTADGVRALGHAPLVAPLLTLAPHTPPKAALALDDVAALAFTSARGVEAYAALSPGRERSVYAVGAATAAAARAAGFTDVRCADGDGAALAALIADDAARPSGVVLAPGARTRAFDLPSALSSAGVHVREAVVYAATPAREAPPMVMAALDGGGIDGVLLHSAAAARALRGVIARDASRRLLAALERTPVYALSPDIAAALPQSLRGLRHVAAAPREPELLALLRPA